tara:strand:- start:652 stop:1329 length:678 start_codon:yes stop_codon:yes gene_type:complete
MFRRNFFLTSSSFLLFSSISSFSNELSALTHFDIIWRDLNIGHSKIAVTKKNQKFFTTIDVLINVKLFGFNFFHYKLNCSEEWENKQLISISSFSKSNNAKYFVEGKRVKNGFKVKGSAFEGILEKNIGTTSYFTPDFLKRKIWLSTQDGKPLKINSNFISKEKISILKTKKEVNNFEITGDLQLNLVYSSNDEWLGSTFKAGGSIVSFNLKRKEGNINNIWNML